MGEPMGVAFQQCVLSPTQVKTLDPTEGTEWRMPMGADEED